MRNIIPDPGVGNMDGTEEVRRGLSVDPPEECLALLGLEAAVCRFGDLWTVRCRI